MEPRVTAIQVLNFDPPRFRVEHSDGTVTVEGGTSVVVNGKKCATFRPDGKMLPDPLPDQPNFIAEPEPIKRFGDEKEF